MNRRLLGNFLILTFLILSMSGVLMYLIPFNKKVASLHTFFALVFLIGVLFHIVNNNRPLLNYISGKRQKMFKKLQGPFIFLIFLLITFGIYRNNLILNYIYDWGNMNRNQQLGITEEIIDYQIIELEKTIGSQKMSIEVKKGRSFKYPLLAVWVEDSIGNYIETLYVSKQIASSVFGKKNKVSGIWEPTVIRRPEALPYWSHKRGIIASDGLYLPLNGPPDLDGVTGATPTSNFMIKTRGRVFQSGNYKIFLEINQSYDWNEYYSAKRFPDDLIYSGSGNVGQPSLVYSTKIILNDSSSKTYHIMNLIGHGHHSGKNGKLYTDLKNITSAKMIADRIIVTIEY